ncbi:MAG: hypothetical protein KGI80_01975 [Verrucomicrobiota bacterium]|nr:hypothetical protein [Verrucomicrobiota bacterium]
MVGYARKENWEQNLPLKETQSPGGPNHRFDLEERKRKKKRGHAYSHLSYLDLANAPSRRTVLFSPEIRICLIAHKKEFQEAKAKSEPDALCFRFLSLDRVLWQQPGEKDATTAAAAKELTRHVSFAETIQLYAHSLPPAQGMIGDEETKAYKKWHSLLQNAYNAGIRTFSKHSEWGSIRGFEALDVSLFFINPREAVQEICSPPPTCKVPANSSYGNAIFTAKKILTIGMEVSKLKEHIDSSYAELELHARRVYKRGVDHFLKHGTDEEKELAKTLQHLDAAKHRIACPEQAVTQALYAPELI